MPNGRWEAESCIQNRKAVEPLVVSLEETCEKENGSQEWPQALK
jgi:hypothetical protein